MPISVSWYDDKKTMIYSKYEASWSLEEYYESVDITSDMIKSVSHAVVTFADFSNSGPMPAKFLSTGRHSENVAPENGVAIYIFGLDRYMELVAKMFQKMFPRSTRGLTVVSSFAEAMEKAKQVLAKSAN